MSLIFFPEITVQPDWPFHNIEPQNSSIGVFWLLKIRWSMDFDALKWWKGRSGNTQKPRTIFFSNQWLLHSLELFMQVTFFEFPALSNFVSDESQRKKKSARSKEKNLPAVMEKRFLWTNLRN